MPRQSRGSSAPRRPTAAPARSSVTPPRPAPSRPATTAAHPPATAQQPQPPAQAAPQQSAGPGLFGQMASTAAGVAVGSSIGHAIGGFFGGGSSSAPAETQATQTAPAEQQYASSSNFQQSGVCQTDINNFRKCMDENQGSLNICGWYLDQLKACQQAASQY